MIKLSFLSCLVLLISIMSMGQQRDKAQEPPRKANKIIVMVKDTANALLNRLSGILFDKGYTIEAKDEQAKYIITKGQPSKSYGTISKIRARINDTAIIFTSQLAVDSERDIFGVKRRELDYMDVDYSGAKKSAFREAWNELDAIAHMFGDKIVYSK